MFASRHIWNWSSSALMVSFEVTACATPTTALGQKVVENGWGAEGTRKKMLGNGWRGLLSPSLDVFASAFIAKIRRLKEVRILKANC